MELNQMYEKGFLRTAGLSGSDNHLMQEMGYSELTESWISDFGDHWNCWHCNEMGSLNETIVTYSCLLTCLEMNLES